MNQRKTKRFWTILVGVLFLLTMVPFVGYAEVPQQINYQGKLTDADGNPVADDNYLMGFSIYDVATGGTPLWGESQTVTVTNGIYDVILGQPGNLLDPDDFDGNRYLGVTVRADAEMTPRQKLTSTAFSMKAAKADDADTLDGKDSTALDQSAHVGDTNNPHSVTAAQTGAATMSDITWGKLSNIPPGFADNVDDTGITTETDPTVIGYVKDGVSWGELSGIPSGFADNVDNVGMTTSSDYGRSGVATYLYEGTTALINKYVFKSGDTMSANIDSAGVLRITNTGTGMGLDAETSRSPAVRGVATDTGTGINYGGYFEAYRVEGRGVGGVTNGSSARGVYGLALGTNGFGVYGEATGYNGWAGYFSGRLYASGKVGIGTTALQPYRLTLNTTEEEGGIDARTSSSSIWHNAVYGYNTGQGSGVFGQTKSTLASEAGVYARNDGAGPGIIATAGSGGYAGVFHGNIKTEVLEITGGSDLSEQFDIRGMKEHLLPSPGMVVSIDPENPGDLMVSNKAYDRRVAGIISGAGGVQPGMLMGQKGSEANGANPVALTGRVYCLVDASNGSIEPGDLLTTSDTPGHAMKVSDYTRAQGAVIGKAMTSLEEGTGLVLMLVALQ